MNRVCLALSLAFVAACTRSETPANDAVPADFTVTVSGGGGVAGSFAFVRMDADGRLVAGEDDRVGNGAVLDEAARAQLWRVVRDADLAKLGCKPGNMTTSIESTANAVTTRACAEMSSNRALESLAAQIDAFLGSARSAIPAAPLPRMPAVLWVEVREGGNDPSTSTVRVARLAPGVTLPDAEMQGARALDDARALALWEHLLRARALADLSHEVKAGTPLPGAPYACAAGAVSLRVRTDLGAHALVRQGCITAADTALRGVVDAVRALR